MSNDSIGAISLAILVSGVAVTSEYLKPKKAEPYIAKAHPMANGYDVEIGRSGLVIGRYNPEKNKFMENEGILYGRDFNNDGRIDEITLENVAVGNDLEKLANLETLKSIRTGLIVARK